MFGAPHKKPTILRRWGGGGPADLAQTCSTTAGDLSCGNVRHQLLEFGAGSTAAAADYPPGLCSRWARAVADHLTQASSDTGAREQAELQEDGRVKRHRARGDTEDSRREQKVKEDAAAWAGARNPWQLQRTWPQLWRGLEPISDILCRAVQEVSARQDLSAACGKEPQRGPPEEHHVEPIRAAIAKTLGCDLSSTASQHPCSPWQAGLIESVQRATDDTDTAIVRWMRDPPPWGSAAT